MLGKLNLHALLKHIFSCIILFRLKFILRVSLLLRIFKFKILKRIHFLCQIISFYIQFFYKIISNFNDVLLVNFNTCSIIKSKYIVKSYFEVVLKLINS